MKYSAILLFFVIFSFSLAKANQDDPIFEIECFYQEHFIPANNAALAFFSSDKIRVRTLSERDDDKELAARQYRDNSYYTAFASTSFGGIGGEEVTTRAGDTVTLELSMHDKSVPDFGRMKTEYIPVLIHKKDAQLASRDYPSLILKLSDFPSTIEKNETVNTVEISCATGERGFRGPQ